MRESSCRRAIRGRWLPGCIPVPGSCACDTQNQLRHHDHGTTKLACCCTNPSYLKGVVQHDTWAQS